MTVAPIAARAAAGRAGAGKVIDVTPTASRPLRATGGRGQRVSDAAAGAGASSLIDGGQLRRAGRGAARAVAPASSARRVLVAEFTVCMVVLAFSPLTDKNRGEKPGAFMKRASATMGVFFILGIIATGGRGASKAAAGFGGLVTLVLLISQRSIFTVLTSKLGKGVGEDDPDSEGIPNIGEIIEDIGENIADDPLPPRPPYGSGIR